MSFHGTKTTNNRTMVSNTVIKISITSVNGTISLYNKIIIMLLRGSMVTQCADSELRVLVACSTNHAGR